MAARRWGNQLLARFASRLRASWLGRLFTGPLKVAAPTLIYLLAILLLISGLLSALLEGSRLPTFILIYPSRSTQTIPEVVINALVLALAGGGLYLWVAASRRVTRPRTAHFYFVIGLIVEFLALTIGLYILSFKTAF